jgi:hypothetical protein
MAIHIFPLMDLIIIRKVIEEIYLHILLIQGISNIFTERMQNYLAFKMVHFKLAPKL